MHVTIELPADISEVLQGRWGDVSRHTLEVLALDAYYRTGVLSENQIKRLLGLENRFQVHALLKEHRVSYRYSELDLQDDLRTHRELGILQHR